MLSDSVSVTFEFQKTDERDKTVTMHWTGDQILCPVRAWGAIVRRIRVCPGASPDTTVNAFFDNGKLRFATGDDIVKALRAAVEVAGEVKLGLKASEVGCHSIRSGAAMAMCLDEVPVHTIMMIGRWSSDAFLRCIRKQLKQFSHNVLARMIRN